MTRHGELKRAVMDLFIAHRCIVLDYRSAGINKPDGTGWIPMRKKGVADVIVIQPYIIGYKPHHRVLFCEIKVGRDKLSAHQRQFRQDVLKIPGCEYIEVRDLNDVLPLVVKEET